MIELYYLRDNHSVRKLTEGKELEAIQEEFDNGFTGGMLCGYINKSCIGRHVHAEGKAKRQEFLDACKDWIASVYKEHPPVKLSPVKHPEQNYEFENTHSCVLFTKKADCKNRERTKLYVQCLDAYRNQRELCIEHKHRAGNLEDLYWEVHAYRHPGVRQVVEVSEGVAVRLIDRFIGLCDEYPTLLFNNYQTRVRGSGTSVDRALNEGFVRFHTLLLDGATPSVKLLP